MCGEFETAVRFRLGVAMIFAVTISKKENQTLLCWLDLIIL